MLSKICNRALACFPEPPPDGMRQSQHIITNKSPTSKNKSLAWNFDQQSLAPLNLSLPRPYLETNESYWQPCVQNDQTREFLSDRELSLSNQIPWTD
jgi:hypothetical protein